MCFQINSIDVSRRVGIRSRPATRGLPVALPPGRMDRRIVRRQTAERRGRLLSVAVLADRGPLPESTRRGFSLIELLVVLLVIAIVVGLLLPAVQFARESGRRTACMNNLRQQTLALLDYEAQYRVFPAGAVDYMSLTTPCRTWMQSLLPFLGQLPVWDQANADYEASIAVPVGHQGHYTLISTFQCPSDPDSGVLHATHHFGNVACTNYLGVAGLDYEREDGVLHYDSRIRAADISDGLSTTLIVGERPPSPDFWYGWWYVGMRRWASGNGDCYLGVRERKYPAGPDVHTEVEDCPPGPYQFEAGQRGRQCDVFHFWSHHPGGAGFAMADGSVHFIGYGANEIMPALATRNGSEVVGAPE